MKKNRINRNRVTLAVIAVFLSAGFLFCENIDVKARLAELKDKSPMVRMRAVELLGQAGDKSATDALITLFRNEKSVAVKEYVMDAMSRMGDPKAQPLLLEVLHDTKQPYGVRTGAGTALGFFRTQGSIDVLGRMASDEREDKGLRITCVHSLGMISNSRVVPYLKEVLKSGNTDIRITALSSLGKINGSGAMDAVSSVLSDSDTVVRRAAVSILGEKNEDGAYKSLEKALKDKDPEVRKRAQEYINSRKKR